MYSNYRSIQILISLMKQNNIENIVLSPGGSDIPLIHSIETDSFFKCYSVVDERSAAYYAMGLSQQLNKVVACICTSGSAVCNYLPGITEAFYQSVPVLAITADKNPYFQGQLEIQKINQSNIFEKVVKKEINLPLINSEEDEWLCNRLINEALIELKHHGKGPVHINIPIVGSYDNYECEKLPVERKITVEKLHLDTNFNKYIEKLKDKKILIVVGQNIVFNKDLEDKMSKFFDKYNCIYAVEHLSNLHCKGCVYTYPLTEIDNTKISSTLLPDIVISLGNNLAAYGLKPALRKNYKIIENWLISEDGEVRDAYKCLTTIFECSVDEFFDLVVIDNNQYVNNHSYYDIWKQELSKITLPTEYEFSNFYVAQQLAKIIPEKSILHLAVLNSIRTMQYFALSKNIRTYANVGTLGIDGCVSSFAGQAAATDNLAFLLVGDLSFFYDMNAAGVRSISNNVRIILINNGGGSEFHFFMDKNKIPTINEYICAEHDKVAAGWIKSLGFDYYCANTKEEFDKIIIKFGAQSNRPMFLEVLTDMEEDALRTKIMYQEAKPITSTNVVKQMIKKIVPEKQIAKFKKILEIIKE